MKPFDLGSSRPRCGPAGRLRKAARADVTSPDFELVGRVIRLEKNELELVFERTGVPPETAEADRCAVG
jgi:hypothetical protein